MEVNASGQSNWRTGASATEGTTKASQGKDSGLPIADLQLVDTRVVGGVVSYRDTRNGLEYVLQDLDVSITLAGLDQSLEAKGTLTLNDEPVMLKTTVTPLRAST